MCCSSLTSYAILWNTWYMVVEKAQGAAIETQFVHHMKLLREMQRISQGDLAARMVNAGWEYWRQTTVSRVEKFERTVRLGEAHDIAKILGLPLAEMMTVSEEAQNQSLQAAERRRDLDDSVSRLSESMASFTAHLEQFRTILHRANTVEEESAPVRIQYGGEELTEVEVRDGINPEA